MARSQDTYQKEHTKLDFKTNLKDFVASLIEHVSSKDRQWTVKGFVDIYKNIQFPYSEYWGHFCLGIIYSRAVSEELSETRIFNLDKLESITSVIREFQFFVCEKWELASDSGGSGNTANIGSVVKIADILSGNGVFKNPGESWFDDYWMNYGKINRPRLRGKKIRKLKDFLKYRGADPFLANPCVRCGRTRKSR